MSEREPDRAAEVSDPLLNADGTATSATLLVDVRDWRNAPAWREFFVRYDALLFVWCRELSLVGPDADELRQRIWIELAERMRTFRYDPRKSFRGWLRTLCRSRGIDFLRQRKCQSGHTQPLAGALLEKLEDKPCPPDSNSDESDRRDAAFQQLLREAELVQAAARKRVKPRTWNVFWEIAIADRTIAEVAAEYQMSYAAAFEAYARVGRILREEAGRGIGMTKSD